MDRTERFYRIDQLLHERRVAPLQTFLHAWCHLRLALRSFALDAMRYAAVLDRAARPVAERTLDAQLAAGYGIFCAARTRTARLRFTPQRARWVAHESWHRWQLGAYQDDGHWVLEFPYSDERELLADILEHGDQVEVLAPRALRERVRAAHLAGAERNR